MKASDLTERVQQKLDKTRKANKIYMSDVIEKLQEKINEHGNCEVRLFDRGVPISYDMAEQRGLFRFRSVRNYMDWFEVDLR